MPSIAGTQLTGEWLRSPRTPRQKALGMFDRARFAKAQPYMVRKDDQAACKNIRCRKRFEIAGLQSVAFIE